MGGGGKTTLAKAVFDRISIRFEGKAFVENVREVSESSMNKLQQQVLSSVLSNGNITVNSVHEGTNMMKTSLHGTKVLIVLDDVNDRKQLEALAGEPGWFKPGSRVIITSRDKQVLLAHGVKVIDVNLLSRVEAMLLLCKNAFKRDISIEGYEILSRQVVKYADGLPLTIKVLGSMLYGQNESEWKDTLKRLRTIPLKETLEKLELSYKILDDDYKQIFLDVACILKGEQKEDAIIVLESCGFHARNGLKVLEQRSLITITEDRKLWMHDHIEEMGMNIVRRVNPKEPKQHSRLWIPEETEKALANNSATPATQCITQLYVTRSRFEMSMKGLANMKELRFLDMDTSHVSKDEVCNWKLLNALRFLKWDSYPFSSLPKTFQPNYLVVLVMKDSKIRHLWKNGEEKVFSKLQFLNFTISPLRTLDLSVAPNLERLILDHCPKLIEIHFHVTPNLKELCINNCDRLEKLHMPAECRKLTFLDLSGSSKLRTLHLGVTPNLETLCLSWCTDMVELHMLAECPKLVDIDLSYCSQLAKFPEEIGRLECLKKLDIYEKDISQLPESIFRVKGLRIVGSRQLLDSCGFSSEIKRSGRKTFCYI